MKKDINIGFIGLGNLGRNLANNILLAKYNLFVYDINKKNTNSLVKKGAIWCKNLKKLVDKSTIIINCLPNPKAVSNVIESNQGLVNYINSNHLIIECSTTDEEETIRLSSIIRKKNAKYLEAPLSGGEHRSVTGNISIFVAGDKFDFNRALPIFKEIGYEILYLGNQLGSASTIKVLTNYLASINLLSISEVFMISKKYGLDLRSVYEAIRISSGNSFVHTTEAKVILSGSYNAQFTMDLICKDLGLVRKLQKKHRIPSELIPKVEKIFKNGKNILGERAFSTSITKILEKKCNTKLRAKGFPTKLLDNKPKKKGIEIKY